MQLSKKTKQKKKKQNKKKTTTKIQNKNIMAYEERDLINQSPRFSFFCVFFVSESILLDFIQGEWSCHSDNFIRNGVFI